MELWGSPAKKQENELLDINRSPREWSAQTMSTTDTIREKLAAAFAPAELSVTDESALHEGHAGAQPGGETHFRVRIVASAFDGLSRVDRQRQVYAALGDAMKDRIHALALTTLTPAEASR
jgi:BolA protein